ncbi:MAG: SRPBCC family protein [Alphaproteobacteria bacterium]|nr:MAG: SRPBCC family protein [Alphaproteobacteria bacterium]
MILARTTEIAAPPRRVFAFFEEMESNYTRWHPDHIAFRWLQPGRLAVGNRFHFEERIHGQHIRRTVRLTRVESDRMIEFVPDNALIRFFLRGVTFRIEPADAGCRFTQEIRIRIGPLGRAVNRSGLAAVARHMAEEGENLKAIAEGAG